MILYLTVKKPPERLAHGIPIDHGITAVCGVYLDKSLAERHAALIYFGKVLEKEILLGLPEEILTREIEIAAKLANATDETDSHTSHCCVVCGCKYYHFDCTVTNGNRKQELPHGEQYSCGY